MTTVLVYTIHNATHARGECSIDHGMKDTPEAMRTSKSNRPPLRGHFIFQANTATFLSWTTLSSPRARA
eukprot:7609700-Pyramimonas_sp.AAC.1